MDEDEVFRSEVEQLQRQIDSKKQMAEAKNDVRIVCDDVRGVKFLEMTPLKVVQMKIGKEGMTSPHHSSKEKDLAFFRMMVESGR